jgi:hypothetical protein
MADPLKKKKKLQIGDKVGKTERVRDTEAGTLTKIKKYKDDSGNSYSSTKTRNTLGGVIKNVSQKISNQRLENNKRRLANQNLKTEVLKGRNKKIESRGDNQEARSSNQQDKLKNKIEKAKLKAKLAQERAALKASKRKKRNS